MEEWKKREQELAMLDEANRNSFEVVTGRKQMEDIVETNVLFVHDPTGSANPDDITAMMEYFVETEEYEKCAELRDILARESS